MTFGCIDAATNSPKVTLKFSCHILHDVYCDLSFFRVSFGKIYKYREISNFGQFIALPSYVYFVILQTRKVKFTYVCLPGRFRIHMYVSFFSFFPKLLRFSIFPFLRPDVEQESTKAGRTTSSIIRNVPRSVTFHRFHRPTDIHHRSRPSGK